MIEKPTVFVLGAGAHCSYGFPSGRTLKQKAVAAVRDSLSTTAKYDFSRLTEIASIAREEIHHGRREAFAHSLEHSGQGSIDAFLNANRHQLGFETIGKAAIAQVLLEHEQSAHATDDDWLSYLFEVMIDGVDNVPDFIGKNSVSFITFNYDRFLESWLFDRLMYSFGLEESVALEYFAKLRIYHVYGSLGSFTPQRQTGDEVWIDASRSIRTIFDAEKYDHEIAESRKLIQNAQVVCLLGYGFHRENTELLMLVECVRREGCIVASSRYEIHDAEWQRVTYPFAAAGVNIRFSPYPLRCLGSLRVLPVF